MLALLCFIQKTWPPCVPSVRSLTRSAKSSSLQIPLKYVFLGQLLSLRRAFTRSPGDVLDAREGDVMPVRHMNDAARVL